MQQPEHQDAGDPEHWPVRQQADAHNRTRAYGVEHDSDKKVDKRSGKPARVKKFFVDAEQARACFERLRDAGRKPKGFINYVR